MASGRIARARLSFPSLVWALKYELKETLIFIYFYRLVAVKAHKIAFTETEIPCTCTCYALGTMREKKKTYCPCPYNYVMSVKVQNAAIKTLTYNKLLKITFQ